MANVNIENFEGRALINSPRSLEACLRSGYDPKELLQRPGGDFRRKNEAPEVTKMRAEHFERKREEKVGLVLQERAVIMEYLQEQEEVGALVSSAAPGAEEGGGESIY